MQDLYVLVGQKAAVEGRKDTAHIIGNIKNELLDCAELSEVGEESPLKLKN